MGNGTSKSAGDGSQHVFAADAPVRFSSSLVDSLQSSPQSDTTRQRAIELEIQNRVHSELEKLQAHDSARLKQLQEEISAETTGTPSRRQQPSHQQQGTVSEKQHDIPGHSDAVPETISKASDQQQPSPASSPSAAPSTPVNAATTSPPQSTSKDLGPSRDSVLGEIKRLREKLEARQKADKDKKPDAEVEKAKGQVIACLRVNDRRPLDCWKEVETFRREVGRLEKGFVEKAAR